MRLLLQSFLPLVALLGLTGCRIQLFSDEGAKAFGSAFAAGFGSVARQMSDARDVGFAFEAFYRKQKRWPSGYPELAAFVEHSDGYLRLRQYDDMTFLTQPDGGVQIVAVRSGNTNRITYTAQDLDQK
jgi:hypothetical protein